MSDSLRSKIRSGLLWSALQNWGVRLSSLLLFMVLARLLTPEQLGLFAASTVVLAFLNLLAEQGLGEAVVQRETITQQQMNSVFLLNMGVSLLIVVLLWFMAPWVARWMKLPELVDILRVSSLAMPLTAAAFGQMAMRKRNFQYRWLATTALISTVLSGVVALVLVLKGFGVWSLVVQSLAYAALVTAMLWFKAEWRFTWDTDFRGVRPLMAYGGNRLFTYVLDFANTRYIEIFLASALGPAALAVYSVGVRVHQALMQTMSSTILEVAHNGFSRLANDRPALINAYYKSVTATATLAVPVFCLVGAVAPSLTVTLFGARWEGSAEVMRLMSILGAVQVIQFYNGTVYNAIGRPVIGSQFMVLKVALTFGALWFVRDGGLTALLYAFLISQLATTPLSFYLVHRLIGVSLRELLRRIWPFFTGSAVMMAVAMGVAHALQNVAPHPIVIVLGASVAGGLTYLLYLRLVAPAALKGAVAIIRPHRAAS